MNSTENLLARQIARDILQEVMSDPTMSQLDNFGDLHDICDANCLGGLCEPGHLVHSQTNEIDILNEARDRVNAALGTING